MQNEATVSRDDRRDVLKTIRGSETAIYGVAAAKVSISMAETVCMA